MAGGGGARAPARACARLRAPTRARAAAPGRPGGVSARANGFAVAGEGQARSPASRPAREGGAAPCLPFHPRREERSRPLRWWGSPIRGAQRAGPCGEKHGGARAGRAPCAVSAAPVRLPYRLPYHTHHPGHFSGADSGRGRAPRPARGGRGRGGRAAPRPARGGRGRGGAPGPPSQRLRPSRTRPPRALRLVDWVRPGPHFVEG